MELEIIKKLIQNCSIEHSKFVKLAKEAERYYKTENDIKTTKSPSNNHVSDNSENPLRNADNRIPFDWYKFLVNQKTSYMFTYPPTFDVGDDNINMKIAEILGDSYPKEAKVLCKNASNCGVAWLHVWIDENNEFQYANVDPKQITPIYSSDLKRKLTAVLRAYDKADNEGNDITVYEYWTDKEVYSFSNRKDTSIATGLKEYKMFTQTDLDTGEVELLNRIPHSFGCVPFVEFDNNDLKNNDLKNVKPLIDVYDKVYSGFVNDVEDIQEIIFVLTNFGGSDLTEFLKGLKKYKTVDMQSSGVDDKSGLSTITIDIPIEARKTLLETTEKQIYIQGQGVDPVPENFANTSGVALKFLYTLLELKAGLMETEFRLGFGKLVRIICSYLNHKPKKVIQTWTRNMITNETETATIAKESVGIISDKTILKNHPFVENADEEEEQIKKEKKNIDEDYFPRDKNIDGGKDET